MVLPARAALFLSDAGSYASQPIAATTADPGAPALAPTHGVAPSSGATVSLAPNGDLGIFSVNRLARLGDTPGDAISLPPLPGTTEHCVAYLGSDATGDARSAHTQRKQESPIQ